MKLESNLSLSSSTTVIGRSGAKRRPAQSATPPTSVPAGTRAASPYLYPAMTRIYPRFVKPAVDRAAAVALLVAFLPVLIATALVLRVNLGRGVLLWQERVGQGGATFRMCKFRTMLPDRRGAELDSGPEDRRVTHKAESDPRHTPVGRFLRRASFDELPQLWNVIRGEMSLVGPRPELVRVVDRHDLWGHPRHLVKPGITGPWQLSASRNASIAQTAHIDLGYLETLSPRIDVMILLRTLFVPFRKSGT